MSSDRDGVVDVARTAKRVVVIGWEGDALALDIERVGDEPDSEGYMNLTVTPKEQGPFRIRWTETTTPAERASVLKRAARTLKDMADKEGGFDA